MAFYTARRKEIEDSYVESGLEVPLPSRNMNASVYAMGPSFEPVGRDYRAEIIRETNARNAAAAKHYDSIEVPETEDIDELNKMVQEMSQRLAAMETELLNAELSENNSEASRIKQESIDLRSKRDNTVNKIKALKASGVRSASASGVSHEFQEKVAKLEDQTNALKVQISTLRSDMYDIKDSLMIIMDRLGIDRYQRDEDD